VETGQVRKKTKVASAEGGVSVEFQEV